MAQHIVLMNVIALAMAMSLGSRFPVWLGRSPYAAAAVQIVLLWGWHAPPVLDATFQQPVLHLIMQASLFVVALWFWRSVLAAAEGRPWASVATLLVTSKLFCLLGVLLIFAGASLYAAGAHNHAPVPGLSPLEDQQMAGLLMIVACPLSYLGVGVFLTARWLGLFDRRAADG